MSLQQVLAGHLVDWQGIPGSATQAWLLEQARPLVRVGLPEEKVRIGSRFRVITLERETAPTSLEAWLVWDRDEVELIEYDDAPVDDLEALLHLYGTPDTILKGKRFALDSVVQEFVYAQRGITLSVGTPFEGDLPRRIVHIQLYPARSLQYYLTVIGTGSELHPFPRT